MKRPKIMGHHGRWRSKLLRLWQQWESVGAEITLHHPDDQTSTDFEVKLPSWPWRWVCWIQGHCPYDSRIPQDNYCVVCRKHPA